MDETEKCDEDNVTKRKFNFEGKRKCKFSNKKRLDQQKVLTKELRATPEGKLKHQDDERERMRDIRATPEGKLKHQNDERKN